MGTAALLRSPPFAAGSFALVAQGAVSVAPDDPKYVALIETLSKKYQFDKTALRSLLSQAILKPEIITIFDRPPEKLPYYEYRKRFITDTLILRGRDYLREHLGLLQKVEHEFGVQKEVICGILGIETKFGQPGLEKYRAFDILNTGYALYSRREAFYRDELISFLLLCREEGRDPLALRSSYAGAMGVPQFMPSSLQKYALDYDGDGKRNLWDSHPDIFASVANYLKTFGWTWGGRTHLPARITRDRTETQTLLGRGVRHTVSVEEASQSGVQVEGAIPQTEQVAFASYQPEAGVSRLLALFGNFRALLGYNFSVNYALTVTALSSHLADKP
jgi:membrane-bound lytic murein transglycosylase B